MSLSCVVPTYSINDKLISTTLKCLESLRPLVDELIVTEDGERVIPEIANIADLYLFHKNLGYARNANLGWKMATHEYVLHANADTHVVSGNLQDLCIDSTITSPKVNEDGNILSGAFFCVPRSVSDELGMFNDYYMFDGADHNLWNRYLSKYPSKRVESVIVRHEPGGLDSPFRRSSIHKRAI